ncbi:MAG: FliI/YscN family ATPase [Planctomycetales bacterium]|nr:FliI/YscN family ATPase [Planctomycetales bacterium]
MPTRLTGRVVSISGTTLTVAGFPAPFGAVVHVERDGQSPIPGEVIGFDQQHTLVYPLDTLTGVRTGTRVRLVRTQRTMAVGEELLGRVINGHAQAIDSRDAPTLPYRVLLDATPPSALERPPVDRYWRTGIRAIDGLLTCGEGQRIGIFAGSGVGKSVTLGMMAQQSSADINVIALIGERGREVNHFLTTQLGAEALRRSVVIVSTSDEPALLRVGAALVATTVAEYFRDQGKHVLLLMDSLTRLANAQREVGMARGELATTRGYPPSVFATLSRLIERGGTSANGTISAVYTVLVENDDIHDPIGDAVMGYLDGHIVLSRHLADRGHYPAIDVLASKSRLMNELVTAQHRVAAQRLRQAIALLRDNDDLIALGAYRRGADSRLDRAVDLRDELMRFLQQTNDLSCAIDSLQQVIHLASLLE